MARQFQQAVNRVLNRLRDVESRSWDDILLSSANPTWPVELLVKLAAIAECYSVFVAAYPSSGYEHRLEAYAVLRAAFDGAVFPSRHYLSREQFGLLLDLHLERIDL